MEGLALRQLYPGKRNSTLAGQDCLQTWQPRILVGVQNWAKVEAIEINAIFKPVDELNTFLFLNIVFRPQICRRLLV